MAEQKIFALVNYEDPYVQPLLESALKQSLPSELLVLVATREDVPPTARRFLQWEQYEKIDFDRLMSHPGSFQANSYVIRKALIRKHYLAVTASHWLAKHPDSILKRSMKPTVDFEVDYAEFLDDALVEAYELHESWTRNEGRPPSEREWWILKPGMSDRGQGIRLFSSEEELIEIFEAWDAPYDDDDDDDDDDEEAESSNGDGIITSQLRHFVAQPYIQPPLLLQPPHPSAHRKFHIRTYVVAVGALKVYVYRPMLALFASTPYSPPGTTPNDELSGHLSNTCLQTGERDGSVYAFWSLPDDAVCFSAGDWREGVFDQICRVTGEVFAAAAQSMSIHFQPLPNAFEIFGLDFLVDAECNPWLLEVNAFPDFAQTGEELGGLVRDLFKDVVEVAVKPFFGIPGAAASATQSMSLVLDIDLGKT